MPLIKGKNIDLDSETLESVLGKLGIKLKTSSGIVKDANGIAIDQSLELESLETTSFIRVNVDTPVAAALFQVNSTDKGVLIPRMTTVQRDAIAAPADGLFVYNTTTKQLEWYNDTIWTSFSSSSITLEVNGVDAGTTPNLVDSATIEITQTGDDISFEVVGGGPPSQFGRSRYVLVDAAQPTAIDNSSFSTPFVTITGALSALQDYYLALSSSSPTLYELTKGIVIYVAAGLYDESINWTYTALGQVTIQGLVPLSNSLPLGSTVVAEQLAYGAAVIRGTHGLNAGNLVFKNIYFRYPESGVSIGQIRVKKATFEDCIAVIRSSAQDTGANSSTSVMFLYDDAEVVIRRCKLISGTKKVFLDSLSGGGKAPYTDTTDLLVEDSMILTVLETTEEGIREAVSLVDTGEPIALGCLGLKTFINTFITGMVKVGTREPGDVCETRVEDCTFFLGTSTGYSGMSVLYKGTYSLVKNCHFHNTKDYLLVGDESEIEEWCGNTYTYESGVSTFSALATVSGALVASVGGKSFPLSRESATFPAANFASSAVYTLSTVPYGAIEFDDTEDQYAYFSFMIPEDAVVLKSLQLTWISPGTGDVYWQVSSATPGWTNDSMTPLYSDEFKLSTAAVYRPAPRPVRVSIPIRQSDTELVVGEQDGLAIAGVCMVLRVGRLAGTQASDTLAGSAYVVGVNVNYFQRS